MSNREFRICSVDLENAWTNLLDADCYDQTEMLLEKSENLLQLSVKQLVIQSSLASSISPNQTMFGVWKTKYYCCL